MLVFQNGWPVVLTKGDRRFVVCNGAMGPEEYPGAMLGDLVYGGRTTTGCGSIIDITDAADCHPSHGCGEGTHGALPPGASVAETRPRDEESPE
jgi:hypothetical protein